jgi:peroxiredoxin
MKKILMLVLMLAMAGGIIAAKKKSGPVLSIGDAAPVFKLAGHDGKNHSLDDYADKIVVLEWLNEGCPFVKHHYESGNMQGLQKKYENKKEVVWLSIVSSAEGRQGYFDDNEACEKFIEDKKARMDIILLDPTGKVGRLYGAKTTPHMFVLDAGHKVAYQGAIDDERRVWGTDPAKQHNYVAAAMKSVLAGKPVKDAQTRPYGCSVKYKK